jgi:putative FmdB family regulatory protein
VPIYEFICRVCGHHGEYVKDMGDNDQGCALCNSKMDRLLSPVRINMGVGPYGYYDETLGKHIGTNRERREECRKQGVTPKGETPKPDGGAWV